MLESLRDDSAATPDDAAPVAGSLPELVDRGEVLVCATCARLITWTGARLELFGQHQHECTNPAGVSFHVVCYAAAEGCAPVTNPSSEWSWFPGYQWQIEICLTCRTHLGWLYTRADHSFHGFIADRLRPG